MKRLVARVAASAMLTVVMLEGLLRLAGLSYPSYHAADPLLGYRLRANVTGRWTREGRCDVRLSSRGWHDAERALEKPAGTKRVLVLGDSYVEAFQLPRELNLCSRLQQELSGCAGGDPGAVEVLSMGCAGYGTAQALLVYRHEARAYSPDVVVLAFFPGNDVRNNSFELEPERMRPFFLPGAAGLELDASFRDLPGYAATLPGASGPLLERLYELRFLQLCRKAATGAGRILDAATGAGTVTGAGPRMEAGLDAEAFAEPRSESWKGAWSVTEELVRELGREVARDGARLLVAVLPFGAQVSPDARARDRLAKELGLADFSYPERRLERLCREAGIEFIALSPPFLEEARRTGASLHGYPNTKPDTGHWNEAGHRLAGRLLAAPVCELLRTPGPRHR